MQQMIARDAAWGRALAEKGRYVGGHKLTDEAGRQMHRTGGSSSHGCPVSPSDSHRCDCLMGDRRVAPARDPRPLPAGVPRRANTRVGARVYM